MKDKIVYIHKQNCNRQVKIRMKLQEYLDTYGIKITSFAKKLGKSRTWIYKLLDGHIPHASDALLIEKATEGKVTKEELLFPVKDWKNHNT